MMIFIFILIRQNSKRIYLKVPACWSHFSDGEADCRDSNPGVLLVSQRTENLTECFVSAVDTQVYFVTMRCVWKGSCSIVKITTSTPHWSSRTNTSRCDVPVQTCSAQPLWNTFTTLYFEWKVSFEQVFYWNLNIQKWTLSVIFISWVRFRELDQIDTDRN